MKAYSVTCDGNNEEYIYAKNEEEAKKKYISIVSERIKAEPADKILDEEDYKDLVRELKEKESIGAKKSG